MSEAANTLPVVGEAEWEALRLAAVAAMNRAYAPYSSFKVGAAAMTEDGRTISGCNVENAAYGVTLCAECNMIGELFATGGGKLHAFYCVDARGAALMPCGRCRQLLSEHRGSRMALITPNGIQTMEQVLPDAFGPHNL